MIDSQHSFIYFLKNKLIELFPGQTPGTSSITLYSEPNYGDQENKTIFGQLVYPAIVLHWETEEPLRTGGKASLSTWESKIQIDILFDDNQRFLCQKTTQLLFEAMNLSNDIPGASRRAPKYQFIDDTGNLLTEPILYINSDIQWRLLEPVRTIYEADKPELMRRTFGITLIYKNR
jgi:hypothetical protein